MDTFLDTLIQENGRVNYTLLSAPAANDVVEAGLYACLCFVEKLKTLVSVQPVKLAQGLAAVAIGLLIRFVVPCPPELTLQVSTSQIKCITDFPANCHADSLSYIHTYIHTVVVLSWQE